MSSNDENPLNYENPFPAVIARMERIALILFLIGITFKILHYPFAGPMLIISLGTLAIVYAMDGFQLISTQYEVLDGFQTESIKQENQSSLLNIVTGLFLSIACIGLLFRLMYWPFSQPYLAIATVGLPVVFCWMFTVRSKVVFEETAKKYLFKMLRITLFFALTATLYSISLKTQIDLENWNDPEMARLKYRALSNPTNKAYKKDYLEYRKTK